jgi:hypothetical protein
MDGGRAGPQDERDASAACGHSAWLKPVAMDLSALSARCWRDIDVSGRTVTATLAAVPGTMALTISLAAGEVAALSGEHLK